MKNLKTLTGITLFLLFFGTFFIDAYAYLDPGSGSIVIQLIIGALVGVGITLKIYWVKIKVALETKFSKSKK